MLHGNTYRNEICSLSNRNVECVFSKLIPQSLYKKYSFVAPMPIMASLTLEILDSLLVFLGFFARVERAEIFALACFGILLFRIHTIFP